MSGGVARVLRDSDPLVTGIQTGSGTSIVERGKDFKSTGASVGLAVRNITKGTAGHLTSVTEDQVTADISFDVNDIYEIYCTDTYNAVIGRWLQDRRFGHKTENRAELVDGLFPEDIDVDEHQRHVFGPGQPWQEKV